MTAARSKKRSALIVVVAICAILAVGAALVWLVSFLRRPPPEPIEITVTVTRKSATAASSNETDITEPLEEKIASIAGIQELRSESKASAVKVTCSFDPKAKDNDGHQLDLYTASERVRTSLESVLKMLPQNASPPMVSHETKWGNLAFVRSKEPIRDKLEKIGGISILETCGEASYATAPDYVLIRIDLDKLQAVGLGLDDIEETLIQTQMIRMVSGRTRDPEGFAGTLIREQEPQVRLNDVATVSLEKRKAACTGLTGDDKDKAPRAFVYKLRIDPPLEKSIIDRVKSESGADVILDRDGGLHAFIGFPPGATKEEKARLISRLAGRMKSELTNLTFVAAMLTGQSETAELLFTKTNATTRADIDQLRKVVSQEPGMAWRGAFPQKDVKRLEVALRDQDLGALETQASDLRKKTEGMKGVLSLIRDSSTTRIPQRRITVDRDRASSLLGTEQRLVSLPSIATLVLNENEYGTPFLDDVDLAIDHPGMAALDKARVKKNVPLTALVKIEQTLEPESILHVNRERAVVLEWEVETTQLQAVKKQLETQTKSSRGVVRELDL
jgi:multidrug efflux pump subunit AcrB